MLQKNTIHFPHALRKELGSSIQHSPFPKPLASTSALERAGLKTDDRSHCRVELLVSAKPKKIFLHCLQLSDFFFTFPPVRSAFIGQAYEICTGIYCLQQNKILGYFFFCERAFKKPLRVLTVVLWVVFWADPEASLGKSTCGYVLRPPSL